MRRKYNKEPRGTASEHSAGPLEIVNDLSILAHTDLGKTTRKWRLYIVTSLTCLSDYKSSVTEMAAYINKPELPNLIRKFLHYQQLNDPNASDSDVSVSTLPTFTKKLSVHSSASSVYFAPSDPCGIRGLRREQIRSTWQWRQGPPRQDTVLVNTGNGGDTQLPMSGFVVARVLLFFSFTYGGKDYPVALVWWYILSEDSGHRDEATGMWLIEREYRNGKPLLQVVHVDTILRAVHLLPYFGRKRVSQAITQDNSLDKYPIYYVNRFADHHSFEIL